MMLPLCHPSFSPSLPLLSPFLKCHPFPTYPFLLISSLPFLSLHFFSSEALDVRDSRPSLRPTVRHYVDRTFLETTIRNKLWPATPGNIYQVRLFLLLCSFFFSGLLEILSRELFSRNLLMSSSFSFPRQLGVISCLPFSTRGTESDI